MDNATAWLTLARVPGLHAGHLPALLQSFPDVAALVTASDDALRSAGLHERFVTSIARARADALRDARWLTTDRRHFIYYPSERYPRLLRELPDAPIGLWVEGDPDLLRMAQLAMVGSRNPSVTGRDTAHSFARQLAARGLVVTSGLAVGIDTASHLGALAADGGTIAVCGTGLDVAYPRSNAELAGRIAALGVLVSEFPPGTPPLKHHFPRRNRLIAGLSMGTLVVEAAVRSGSLITARLAGEQGREVFAIPGSIYNPQARGCHQLLRQGAKMVETPEDILVELDMSGHDLPLKLQLRGITSSTAPEASGASEVSSPPLDKGYEILLDALGFESASVDTLVARSGLRAEEVASMLLILELEGRIESSPGGLYLRVHP